MIKCMSFIIKLNASNLINSKNYSEIKFWWTTANKFPKKKTPKSEIEILCNVTSSLEAYPELFLFFIS